MMKEQLNSDCSDHYEFYYHAGTLAKKEISDIARMQENCWQYISRTLKVKPDFKIQYYGIYVKFDSEIISKIY